MGDCLVNCKTGFVSKELPHKKLHGTALYWFNEIEALYAFLLTDSLDKVLIDRSIHLDAGSCAIKYEKLIEQIHPHLKFATYDSKNFLTGDKTGTLFYFPNLETMFKNGELKSVFQPIVAGLSSGHKIIGYECLSRVQFNNVALAPDFLFNYAQEKLQLTNYDKVCLLQSLRLAPKISGVLIFVNVRPQTLISLNFYPWFKEELKKNNLDPKNMVIEITEQHCVISEREMGIQCDLLRDLGIKIAIDDFGSGISNLSMLEITKPDFIKISGRFIKGSHLDIQKQKIIKNVMDLANDLEIKAIVENVETELECQQVAALGVNLAQGFYFYRPMNKADLNAAIEATQA